MSETKKAINIATKLAQSNELTEATYSLSMPAKRLLYLCLEQRKKRIGTDDELSPIFTLFTSDYQQVFGVVAATASRDMKSAVDELLNSYVSFYPNDGTFDVVKVPWLAIAGVKFARGQWQIEINGYLMPKISGLNQRFTSFKLQEVARISNPRIARLYESLCQYRGTGMFLTTPEWLAERYELPLSQRKSPAELKRTFLLPALKKIEEATDLKTTFSESDDGKKYIIGIGEKAGG